MAFVFTKYFDMIFLSYVINWLKYVPLLMSKRVFQASFKCAIAEQRHACTLSLVLCILRMYACMYAQIIHLSYLPCLT